MIKNEQNSGQSSVLVAQQQSTKVLILDDNIEQSNLMRHGLQFHELSFEADFVTTISEAVDHIERDAPDIFISEISVSDGYVGQLLTADPEAASFPVVVFTDKGSEKDAVDLLKAGVMDYVVKSRRKCQEVGDLIKKSLAAWSRIKSIRQAEVNLQQTLRLARNIMDSLPNPIGVLDERGLLLSVNETWKQTVSQQEFFGDYSPLNSEYISVCRDAENEIGRILAFEIEQVLQTQSASRDIVYSASSDQSTWYSTKIHPCSGTGRAKAIVVHQDITDRKRLEESHSAREFATSKLHQLTPRERQVMKLVVTGKPNKSVARALNISVKTVEMHRSNMMKKLKIRSVTDLVRLAVNAGIKTEEPTA